MTFLESMLFLILCVGVLAGIPLMVYASIKGRRNNNESTVKE